MNKIPPIKHIKQETVKAVKTAQKEVSKSNSLERVPKKDFFDFSTEEEGYFRAGDRIIEIIFPR